MKLETNEQQADFLASCELFASFDREVLEKTADLVRGFSIPAGEYLFRQGETKHSGLYIVVEGELRVLVCGEDGRINVVGQIGAGEFVGEVQLLTGQARSADVRAAKPSRFLFLQKSDFEELVAETPEILPLIGEVIRKRLRRNQLFQILPDYFGELSLEQMEAIEEETEWVHLKSGEPLMRFDDPSDDFYILIHGKAQARIPDINGVERPASEILAGANIGELGFFTGEPRIASVYALRDTDLVRFNKEGFHALQSKLPQTTFQFATQVISKLRQTALGRIARKSLYAALVPLSQDISLVNLANQLAETISGYSNCLHLNSKRVDEMLDQVGISQIPADAFNEIRLSTWLDDQEKITPVVCLYEADNAPTNWTKRCLQRADRVIFVGKVGDEPDEEFLAEVMPSFRDEEIHKELILLYDQPDPEPKDTDKWLDMIGGVRRHYHMQRKSEQDLHRISRLLAGKGIGLVLGGGGARGYAHIGVLRAMEEAGLEIDLIGGNSIGAIISAAYAQGMNWQAIYEMTEKWGKSKQLIDYTYPAVSLVAGKSFVSFLKTFFKDRKIEDTWIEYFCVSANLTEAMQMIHRRGDLWKYVRASSALPPVFPPITDEGDLLVDGVLVNNLPLEVMQKICEDCTIIGVDVSTEFSLKKDYDLPPALSGWKLLWSKLNPFKEKLNYPGIMHLFMRINEFSSVRQKYRQYDITDYIIHPDVEGFSVLQFDDFDEIVERGYRAGKEALEKWQGEL